MRKWIEPKQWFPSPLGALQKLDKAIPLVTKKMGVAAQVRSNVLAYVPLNRQEFEECPYDLAEIARASSTESLVAQSFSKHLSLCLKEGWEIAGRDETALAYVKKRLFQMELATATTFDDLIRRAMKNFIETSNVFLVYRRDKTLSPGSSIKKFGKALEPIAGVFSANPAAMQIRRNKFGEEKQYYQVVRSTPSIYFYIADKHFDSSEVLHIAYDRLDGYAWGRPFVISVLDDIRLLRSLEEMASLMCFKSAIPMYQYKVGNENLLPIQYTDGTTELDKVEEDIREKDSHGFFVTPGHHDLKNVDGGNNVRDITKYLDFFRSRVISGLNLSSVDLGMGDTSNRNTANAMSKNLQSKCKDFQKSFSEQVQEFFDELLLEGGFSITPETRVSLSALEKVERAFLR